jgi:tetratricopeptide (TPR) repeat protein
MERRELLDRYEAHADEATYEQAARLYEDALAENPDDPVLLFEYGYLKECRGRASIRAAVASYERAIETDPGYEKARNQLIWARSALFETDEAIALYERRLADRPEDAAEYRFLAGAFLVARDYEEAGKVVAAGLALAPDDPRLVEQEGDVFAATGRPADALERWRRAVELDPDNASPLYSTAFLLEREQRFDEAAAAWRSLIGWLRTRGYDVQAEWPERELARVEARLAEDG